MALKELYFASVLLHAQLQYVEEYLFEVCHFNVCLIMLQKVKACLQEALYEAFIDLLLWPEQMDILLQ